MTVPRTGCHQCDARFQNNFNAGAHISRACLAKRVISEHASNAWDVRQSGSPSGIGLLAVNSRHTTARGGETPGGQRVACIGSSIITRTPLPSWIRSHSSFLQPSRSFPFPDVDTSLVKVLSAFQLRLSGPLFLLKSDPLLKSYFVTHP